MATDSARPVRMDWRDRRDRPLVVPGELLSFYQPVIGPEATLAWLNLAFALQETGVIPDPVRELEVRQGLNEEAAVRALGRLADVQLLEYAPDGSWVLREPAARGELAYEGGLRRGRRMPDGDAAILGPETGGQASPSRAVGGPEASAAIGGPPPSPSEPSPADSEGSREFHREALQAVVDFYHQRIGLLGPVQFEKLRFWVEEKGVSPDVVAAAIEETAASAEHPRIQYLEGILRNWYNEGVRTLQDLISLNHGSHLLGRKGDNHSGRGLAGGNGSSAGAPLKRSRGPKSSPGSSVSSDSTEGAPNAAAYRRVTREEIERWKALHPEEYGR